MFSAKLYSESNQLQKYDTKQTLDDYASKIEWKNHGGRVIDIGCGDGGVTCEILRRYVPENYELLVGCDISSEMVEYATKHYSNHRTQFLQLDISDDHIPDHLISNFDHAFSFYVFNWIQNYEKAFKNTYNILREKGTCLIMLLGYSPIFEAVRTIAKTEKWRHYLEGIIEKYMSPFHDSLEPHTEIEKVMDDLGFKNTEVSCKKISHSFSSMEHLKKFVTSLNPIEKLIPKDKKEEFIDTLLTSLICTTGLREEEKVRNLEPVFRDYVVITAYGKKLTL